jgi:long-chain acyl-CoA synthetase
MTSQVTVASLMTTAYRNYADRPALVDGEQVRSYRELGERVRAIVAGLRELGIRPGDRVAIVSANSAAFIEASQALFVGGFVRVTPSNRLHELEVQELLNDCRARAAFVDEDWSERLRRIDVPTVEHVVALGPGADGRPGSDDLATTQVAGTPTAEEQPRPDDLCALLYTSGTTGKPKGAMLTQANWAAMVRNSLVELPPAEVDDVVLHVAPLSHFSGYVEPTYTARGACHVVAAPFVPAEALRLIAERAVTVVPAVPTMVNMLVQEAESGSYDVSSLRAVVYGGSSIAPARLARAVTAFGDVFVQFFGLSETPMPLTALSSREHAFERGETAPTRLASAGRVSPFVELQIRDDEGREVEPGQVGEIVVRGDNVMVGYWERPEQTAAVLRADGWAATGDLGRLEGGYLYIVDRKKDLIITGGYNVYPNEVENAIATLPEVDEVVVVGVPDETWGEGIHAAVVRRPGAQLSERDVVDACLQQLAPYKKPRSVSFVDSLPRTGSGKLKRREVRDQVVVSVSTA